MAYDALIIYEGFSNQSKYMVITGWYVVYYPFQRYVEVDILGLILCLVNNNGQH